jgi:hypothetical protein
MLRPANVETSAHLFGNNPPQRTVCKHITGTGTENTGFLYAKEFVLYARDYTPTKNTGEYIFQPGNETCVSYSLTR